MITIKEFKERTLDAIEKLYADVICVNFPNYAVFWDSFVGGKYDKDAGMIIHHNLEFPRSFRGNTDKCRKQIETIFQVNYTMFTNLAGAHFQLNNLKESLKLEMGDPQRHFLHWEAFETAYIHLGNIKYQLKTIWDYLSKLIPTLQRKKMTDFLNGTDKGEYKRLFSEEGNPNSILNWRNNFCHFSRNASTLRDGFYYVPVNLERNVIWCEQLESDTEDRTDVKLEEDLHRVELLLNKIEGVFCKVFKKYTEDNKIEIIKNGV